MNMTHTHGIEKQKQIITFKAKQQQKKMKIIKGNSKIMWWKAGTSTL